MLTHLQTHFTGWTRLICLVISLLLAERPAQSQTINTIVGNGTVGFSGDGGAAINASLNNPAGVIVDGAGTIYIADTGNNRIRKVDAQGIITTIAGNGQETNNGDGGPAINASVNRPRDLALDSKGNLYTSAGNFIRRITPAGIITTLDGVGGGYIAIDGADNIYIAASYDRVYKVNNQGVITTIDPRGPGGGGENYPNSIAVDASGNVYVGVQGSFRFTTYARIFKLDASGNASTIASSDVGLGGSSAKSGVDGIRAIDANISLSGGFAADRKGNLFFGAGNRIRIIDANGLINTVAGNGTPGFSGDGEVPTRATLNNVTDLYIDNNGVAYIADAGNNRIRRATFNLPPTLAGGGFSSSRSATVGVPFSLVITSAFTDPEGRPLTYSSSSLPAGLGLNPSTGLIAGTPVTPGTVGITIGATDDAGITVYSGFLLTIERNPNINQPPLVVGRGLTSPLSATVGVGFSVSTAYAFSDPEGRTLSYISSPLPAGLSLNATTGLISGTPAYPGQVGITVGATDDAGNTVYSGFFLNIQSGPMVVGSGITSPQSATVGVGISIPTAYAFSDPSGRPLRYSSSPLPVGLSLNTSTGVISGTPVYAGTAGITVVATSETNVTVYSGFFLNIRLDPSVNVAPRVVGSGISSPQSGTVGVAFSTPTAYAFADPEGRTLTFSSSSLPDGLIINPSTGVISGTPTRAYTFGVTVGATDDGGSTTYSGFFVTIVNPGGGRVSAEGGQGLQVRVLGNPVQGESLKAIVNGAAGQYLQVKLIDQNGRSVRSQAFESADAEQVVDWTLNSSGSGVYLLQTISGSQRQSVKVVKP